MSSRTTTFPIARKPHRCLWCGERIERGECYALTEVAHEDRHYRNRMHVECLVAHDTAPHEVTEWWDDEGCVPDFERGKHTEVGYD